MLDKKFNSINKQLLLWVLLVSSSFTIVTTLLNFYMDYSNEKEVQLSTLNQIEKSSLGSLSKAVWDLDDQQLKRHVNGLLQLSDIFEINVYGNEGETLSSSKKKTISEDIKKYSFSKSFLLLHADGDKKEIIGKLELRVTNFFLYSRLFKKMSIFFLSQGAKTVIVSFILLFIFNLLVTRHLNEIAAYFKEFLASPTSKLTDLKLDKTFKNQKDEFDILLESINKMISKIVQTEKEKNEELAMKENALKQLAKLATLGEMAGNIGHEINNPLTIIHGGNHRIKSMLKKLDVANEDKEKLVSLIDKVEKATERVQKISKGLSILSRSTDDSLEIIKIKDVLDDTCAIVSEKLRSKGIEVITHFEEEEFHIRANRIQLGQVLINLINNAVHAIENDKVKWIRVETIIQNDNILIKITDSGKGIEDDVKDSIFVPFFTTKAVGKGTGLGLSISSKIITAHQGNLTLDSESENTTFCIELPRVDKFDVNKVA